MVLETPLLLTRRATPFLGGGVVLHATHDDDSSYAARRRSSFFVRRPRSGRFDFPRLVPLLARAADVFVTHGGANALTPQWRREFSEYLAAVPPCVGSSEFWFLDFLCSDSRGFSEERTWPPPRRARVVAAWGFYVLLRVDAHHQPPLPGTASASASASAPLSRSCEALSSVPRPFALLSVVC